MQERLQSSEEEEDDGLSGKLTSRAVGHPEPDRWSALATLSYSVRTVMSSEKDHIDCVYTEDASSSAANC